MKTFFDTAPWLAACVYVAAMLALWVSIQDRKAMSAAALYRIATLIAMTLQGFALYDQVVTVQGFAWGLFNVLSLTSLSVLFALMLVCLLQRIDALGIALLPLAALCTLLSTINTPKPWQLPAHIQWHILISVTGYAVLVLAACQAILLALQAHALRRLKPLPLLANLPSISAMETLLFQIIIVGFILLSLSLLSGVIFIDNFFAQHLAHKTAFSVLGWMAFGVLLIGRLVWGWRGSTALLYILIGLGMLLVGYFGSRLVLEFILQRY